MVINKIVILFQEHIYKITFINTLLFLLHLYYYLHLLASEKMEAYLFFAVILSIML